MDIYIVDTNVLFSAAIRPQSNIGQFIMLSKANQIKLYAPEFLKFEIDRHFQKIVELTGLSEKLAREQISLFYGRIQFIPDREIPIAYLSRASELVRDIDEDDSFFVALTEFLGEYLWTGDSALYRHLISKGYKKVLNFTEIKEKHSGPK